MTESRATPRWEERVLARPSLLACAGLMLGLACVRGFGIDWMPAAFVAMGAAMALFLAAARVKRHASVVALLAWTAAGVMLGTPAEWQRTRDQAGLQLFETRPGQLVIVRGEVARIARRTGSREIELARGANLSAPLVGEHDTLGRLVVRLPMGERPPRIGDDIIALGTLRPLAHAPAPGAPDFAARSRGHVVVFTARRVEYAAPTTRPVWSTIEEALADTADFLAHEMRANLSEEAASLVIAMLLGRPGELSDTDRLAFRRTGLAHLFAVSGLHAGIIGALLAWTAGLLGMGLRGRAVFVIGGLLVFCALTGFPVTALRASVLVALWMLLPLAAREVDPLGALASVALVMLALRPHWMWQLDFQLSFLCALAIVVSGPVGIAIEEVLSSRLPASWSVPSRVFIGACKLCAVSIVIQLAILPVQGRAWGEIPFISPLANVIVLPIVTPVVWLAVGGVLLGAAVPMLAAPLFGSLEALLALMQTLAGALSRLPGAAVSTPAVWPLLATVAWYGVLVSGWSARLRPQFRRLGGAPDFVARTAFAGCLVIALMVLPPERAPMLVVHCLDVGQGDAILVQARDGQTMLVDAGPPASSHRVVRQLQALGVRSLDVLVLTHADADHIGGAPAVIDAFSPRRIVVGGSLARTQIWRECEAIVAERELEVVTVLRGSGWTMAPGVVAHVLHPTEEFIAGDSQRNDASVVLLLEAGDTRVLLTGDAEAESERDMVLELGPEWLRADVLKAGHHGARSSSAPFFVATVQPTLALISCGRSNRYGHPAREVMATFAEWDVEAWRTDTQGTIRLASDGRAWRVGAERFEISGEAATAATGPAPAPNVSAPRY